MADRPYVTPRVKRLAAEHGVDLTRVSGSGVEGRIRQTDVLAAAGVAPKLSTVAASSTASAQVLPIAPRNATEAAAALGPRPGSDWFGGQYALPSERVAQADWDAGVSRFATHEDHEIAQAQGRMHLGGGKSLGEALAEVRAMGDPGKPAA